MRDFADIQAELGLKKFLSSPLGTLYFSPIDSSGIKTMVRHFDSDLSIDFALPFAKFLTAAQTWVAQSPELNRLVKIEQVTEVGSDFIARSYHVYSTSTDAYVDWEQPPEIPEELEQMRQAFRALSGSSSNPQDVLIAKVLAKSILEPTGKTYFDENQKRFIVVEPKLTLDEIKDWDVLIKEAADNPSESTLSVQNPLADIPASDDASAAPSAAEPAITAGEMLRQAREAAGLSIEVLASTLKVPGKKLEALEQNCFDVLPDAVFVRGLAASICRSLKIDAQPVLARLPQNARAAPSVPADTRLQQPFTPSPLVFDPSWGRTAQRLVGWAALISLGFAGLFWAYKHDFWRSADGVESAAMSRSESPETANAAPITLPATPTTQEAQALPPTAAVSTTAPTAAVSAAPLGLAGASAAALAAAAPTPLGATSAALSSTNGILVLRSNQSSWVEVADVHGKVLVRRTLNAGEVVGLSGALPMRVVLGRADAMQVQVRGQAVNLAPLSRDNVARFEVR